MVKDTWTIQKLITWTTQFFKNKNIENPRLNTEVLLSYSLKLDRLGLYLNYDRPLTEAELSSFKKLIKRRGEHEPLQYITGIQEFWSLNFDVTPCVLIPRSETELLVEEVLREVGSEKSPMGDKIMPGKEKARTINNDSLHIVDLGTGCGCIIIALAKELTGPIYIATDNSESALEIAIKNSVKHDVNDKITFISGNMFQPLKGFEGKIDFIVSNPPYIKKGDLEGLAPEVKAFEPISALDGGEDGLDVIRTIINEAPAYLKNNGWLMFEIAFDQASEVIAHINKRGCYTSSSVIKDLSGHDRAVKARVNSLHGSLS